MRQAASSFHESGRLWLRGALEEEDLAILDSACAANTAAGTRISASDALTQVLGKSGKVAQAISPVMAGVFPTRIVAFDKTAKSNWGVSWHQDRIIAVSEKVDHPKFSNWSHKAGIWHCEPPTEVLGEMLFLRLHLDDETAASGPMKIAVGSHRRGKVSSSDAAMVANECSIETCLGKRGDILVLNMLTLHCSQKAKKVSSRRVLRVDYAQSPLPVPLRWSVSA